MDQSKKYEHYIIELGGVPLECCFEFQQTASFFGSWAKKASPQTDGVNISDGFWENWTKNIGPRNTYNEFSAFSMTASEALLEHDRCIIHAAAIRFREQAWLITAPSGVGKSTQVRTLMELYPGEVSVISGDRPILEKKEGGNYLVHPSPWNGKEGWHGAQATPLAGIICLQRGNENKIEPLSTRRSAVKIYAAILQTAEYEATIKKIASFETELLENIPVWLLTNKGVPGSSMLLYKTITKEEQL